MSEQIDRLINSTRKNLEPRVNLEYYAATIETIKSLAHSMAIDVNVKVVYSSSRNAESITIGKSTWLIYDQYMGQTLNLLNRLFIEAENEKPALIYFHKVLAERLLENGKPNEALHCANCYADNRDILLPKHINEMLRATMTGTQEKFCFFHEFSHRAYREANLLPHVREQVKIIIEHQVKEKQLPTEEIINRMRSAPPAAYHHQRLEDVIAEQQKGTFKGEERKLSKAIIDAMASPDFQEEVFCDFLATDIICAEITNQKIDLTDTLRSIYIGFYHLRALELIKNFPNLKRGTAKIAETWTDDTLVSVQARNHCLRSHLLFIYEANLHAHSKLDEQSIADMVQTFSIQLMEDQKRYFDIIYDIAMKLCEVLRRGNRIAKLGKKAKTAIDRHLLEERTTGKSLSAKETEEIVLAMTGWV